MAIRRGLTLFGESAGGTDIVALMHMDVARGLFARAIIESGYLPANALATPAAATRAATDALMPAMSLPLPCWRVSGGRTWSKLDLRPNTRAPLPRRWCRQKLAFRVPLLIGTNADEFRMFLPADPGNARRGRGDSPAGRQMARADDASRNLLQHLSSAMRATRADLLASAPVFHCPAAANLRATTARSNCRRMSIASTACAPAITGSALTMVPKFPYVFGTGANVAARRTPPTTPCPTRSCVIGSILRKPAIPTGPACPNGRAGPRWSMIWPAFR